MRQPHLGASVNTSWTCAPNMRSWRLADANQLIGFLTALTAPLSCGDSAPTHSPAMIPGTAAQRSWFCPTASHHFLERCCYRFESYGFRIALVLQALCQQLVLLTNERLLERGNCCPTVITCLDYTDFSHSSIWRVTNTHEPRLRAENTYRQARYEPHRVASQSYQCCISLFIASHCPMPSLPSRMAPMAWEICPVHPGQENPDRSIIPARVMKVLI